MSDTVGMFQMLRIRVLGLSRATKQSTMFVADVCGFIFCSLAAVWLLFGDRVPLFNMLMLSLASVLVALPLTSYLGLYRSIVRYMGVDLFVAGAKSTALSALALGVLAHLTHLVPSPFRWAMAFWALSLIFLIGSRFLARLYLKRSNPSREPVIIYGAGEGGAWLTQALFGGDDFLPIALVDDDQSLFGKRVSGVEVYPTASIEELIRETGVSRVLLALPSISRNQRRRILDRLSEFPVHVQTIPEISDLIDGRASVDDIRDVNIEDILGRDAVPPDPNLLGASIKDKSVMVTGAGGSIGSELCRQILRLSPNSLLLYEISEVALYNIDKELRKTAIENEIDCEIVALLGSVKNEKRVQEVLQTYHVNTVYHAAAYKHVPLVEQNHIEGIYNNVFGTFRVARAAINSGVDTFVLISTDKAVSPTSIMGASKRFSELVLQALQDEQGSLRFCMVRFGNVLASSGSVVPLFQEQIRRGGPVTVTHREIIRYFMTITEAAQLVIQAGAMAQGGDVFVLDMGRPVKIRDLARRMINLMGLTVKDDDYLDGDIEIHYTGLRPAEKLYEELLIGTNVLGTEHPRIMKAKEEYLPYALLGPMIEQLLDALRDRDCDQARQVLLQTVSGYAPTNGIDDLIWNERNGADTESGSDKIIDITTRRA